MSHGSAADTAVSAEAADVARRSQWPSSPCASRSLCSSSAARRVSSSERAIKARRHLPILHDTASASAGATSVRIANRPGVSMGSSGVEDARPLHPAAYTRDTGKIALGDSFVVRVLYACRQRTRALEKREGRWRSTESTLRCSCTLGAPPAPSFPRRFSNALSASPGAFFFAASASEAGSSLGTGRPRTGRRTSARPRRRRHPFARTDSRT
jgi:hypothetical protein